MFSRKLRALKYHSPDDEILLSKIEDLKPLIVWLEDQKIRYCKIDEREPLREKTGKEWITTFKGYLTSLECPYSIEQDLPAVVDWLLGVAVRYEFEELVESNPDLKHDIGHKVTPPSEELAQLTKSPLDIDPADPTFISGTRELAKILKITSHPDPSVLLEAIRIVIQEKLGQPVPTSHGKMNKSKKYVVTAKECGFDLGDPVLSEAAKTLRLLHIQELRYLQTHINELIVAVQAVTSNPKTDQSLGQVGR